MRLRPHNRRQRLRGVTREEPRTTFRAALRGASLLTPATGATQQTSAASMMFGKDKKHRVMWEAPR